MSLYRLFLLILFLPAISSHAQSAREIVNKYLDTVSNGDIHNWEKITSTYTESIGFYSQGNFDQKINFGNNDKPSYHKTWWVYPNKSKFELYADSLFSHRSSVFYFLPTGTIILLENIPPIKKEPSNFRDEVQYHFVPAQIWNLLNKSESLDLLGVREFAAEKLNCYEIRMVVKDRIYMLYIDTATYFLDYWNNREDHDLTILTGFKNYKRVDDLLFPMTDFMKKNGTVFSQSDITKIELNPPIDPKVFIYEE